MNPTRRPRSRRLPARAAERWRKISSLAVHAGDHDPHCQAREAGGRTGQETDRHPPPTSPTPGHPSGALGGTRGSPRHQRHPPATPAPLRPGTSPDSRCECTDTKSRNSRASTLLTDRLSRAATRSTATTSFQGLRTSSSQLHQPQQLRNRSRQLRPSASSTVSCDQKSIPSEARRAANHPRR